MESSTRTGVTVDGRLIASEIDIVFDGGAYVTLTPVVLSRGAIHALGPYRCDNVRITARAVATNTPPNGAFRGFGAPQVAVRLRDANGKDRRDAGNRSARAATNQHASRRRHHCNRSAIDAERRVRRSAERGDRTIELLRQEAKRCEVVQCADWKPQLTNAEGSGLSFFFHGAGFTGSGEAKMKAQAGVEITADGRARVLSGSTEIGQGTRTIFCQIVADELGVDFEQRRGRRRGYFARARQRAYGRFADDDGRGPSRSACSS